MTINIARYSLLLSLLLGYIFIPRLALAQALLVEREQELCSGLRAKISIVPASGNEKEALSAINDAFTAARESCNLLTLRNNRSETLRLNKAAGEGPVPIGVDLQFLLPRILQIAQWTNGSFDPTAWSSRKKSNYRDIWLDPAGQRAMLKHKGVSLSLRGLIKGYLADRIAAKLRWRGESRYHVTVGGTAMISSGRGKRASWMAGIPDPHRRNGDHVCRVALVDRSLATVADYSWDQSAESFPGAAAFSSVTILAPDTMTADALANAAMVMGSSAVSLFNSSQGVGAVLISHRGKVQIVGSVPATCIY